jgi:chromosome segregation ATPase
MRNYLIFFVTILSIFFTSCVSKKKFVEMQNGRLKAEDMVRQLTEKTNALITDYESMKNELMESNAIKDQYIDSLNTEVFALNDKLNQKAQSLQETSFNLDFEKQRLTNAIEVNDKSIRSLQNKVNNLEDEVQAKSSALDQKNFDMNVLNEKISTLEGQKSTGEEKLANLQAELNKVKVETEKLKTQMKEKDATITRLQNNVKLLKSQIGEN